MRTIDSAVLAALQAGRYGVRDAILFDFAEGLFGFWWGEGVFSWNGLTFQGAGSLLQIGGVRAGGDGQPVELDITLNAMPGSGLSPDVLGQIESYTYAKRPVIFYRFFFSPETGALLGNPITPFRGYLDNITHEQNDGYALVAHCVSRSLDYRRRGYLKRGVETQKVINGGDDDLFFEHLNSKMYGNWGAGGGGSSGSAAGGPQTLIRKSNQ